MRSSRQRSTRVAGWKQRLVETSRANRIELIDAQLTRRDLFKLGLLTSSGFLIAKLGLSSRAAGADGSPKSPHTTPWIEELPVPRPATPLQVRDLDPLPTQAANIAGGEAARADHQAWDQFFDPDNCDVYVHDNVVAPVVWHRELPPDECWLFNGVFPGPRIHARYGTPVIIRNRNRLETVAQHKGYGRPTPTTHLHNAHTASESDGYPLNVFATGLFKDNHYPNACAGFEPGVKNPRGDIRETLTSLWYHDHCVDFTAANVYRGNMGPYYLFNEFDTGDETDTSPTAWRLPSGEFDIPLVFHDRVFDSAGKGYFDLFNLDGILGDKFTVNGKIQPFLRVAPRKYRFRTLNIGVSRFYNYFLSNGQTFVQITHDGNFLPRPLTVKNVRQAVAQRADIIIDFSRLADGTELYLVNCQEQDDGRGPTGKILPASRGDKLLKFIVDASLDTHGDPSRIPDKFLDLPPADPHEAVTTRTFRFERDHGAWAVNGKLYSPTRISASPRIGTAEIWQFVNNSGGWMHPVHTHFEEGQILSRNGKAPPADEISRGDVVWLGHGESVRVFRRFRNFLGLYVTHCHNVVHEDHAMMINWKTVP
jgi:FtsP/CotA-like multicopper oxidase with cupredoxin domain